MKHIRYIITSLIITILLIIPNIKVDAASTNCCTLIFHYDESKCTTSIPNGYTVKIYESDLNDSGYYEYNLPYIKVPDGYKSWPNGSWDNTDNESQLYYNYANSSDDFSNTYLEKHIVYKSDITNNKTYYMVPNYVPNRYKVKYINLDPDKISLNSTEWTYIFGRVGDGGINTLPSKYEIAYGYNLHGYTNEECTIYTERIGKNTYGDKTVYIKAKPINFRYNLILNEYGTLNEDTTGTFTVENDKLLPTPTTKNGYKFKNWVITINSNTYNVNSGESLINWMKNNNVTIYSSTPIKAVYEKVDYDIVLDMGEYGKANVQYMIGDTITLPTPSKDGYIFLYWLDKNNNKVKEILVDGESTYSVTPIYAEITGTDEEVTPGTNTDKDNTNTDKDNTNTDKDNTNTDKDNTNTDKDNEPPLIKIGKKFTYKGYKYKIIKTDEVSLIGTTKKKGDKKFKNLSIANTVKDDGLTFKVTSIGSKAFKDYKYIKKVTIPSNITSIEKQAFYKCKNIKSIVIKSNKIKNIKNKAFALINKKAKFDVPNNKINNYKKLLKTSKSYKNTMKVK